MGHVIIFEASRHDVCLYEGAGDRIWHYVTEIVRLVTEFVTRWWENGRKWAVLGQARQLLYTLYRARRAHNQTNRGTIMAQINADYILKLKAVVDHAETVVRSLAPGQTFLGAFGDAERVGYVKGTTEYEIFVRIYVNLLSAYDVFVDASGRITDISKVRP